MSIIENEIKQRHLEYTQRLDEFLLLRRAADAKLVGIVPKPAYKTAQDKTLSKLSERNADSYIYPFIVESNKNYAYRLQNSIDIPLTSKIVNSYVGKLKSPGYNIESNLPNVFNEKLLSDTDNNGTSFDVFMSEVSYELFLQGKAFVVTDADSNGNPYSFIVRRENVLDWHRDSAGNLMYFMYSGTFETVERRVRKIYPAVWVWEIDKMIRYIYKESGWMSEEFPNNLGYIPVRDAWFNSDGSSMMLPVAIMQVDLVNLISEIRQQIRNQGVGFLTGPRGFSDSLASMSVNSAVELDDGGRDVKWVVYESRGLDAHFSYVDFLKKTILEIGQQDKADPNASGYSKQWSFLDTASMLNLAADSLEPLMMQVINDWRAYRGLQPGASFSINRDFDYVSAREEVDNIILALSAQLDSISETALKMRLRDKLVSLTPDEKKQSDEELKNNRAVQRQAIIELQDNEE